MGIFNRKYAILCVLIYFPHPLGRESPISSFPTSWLLLPLQCNACLLFSPRTSAGRITAVWLALFQVLENGASFFPAYESLRQRSARTNAGDNCGGSSLGISDRFASVIMEFENRNKASVRRAKFPNRTATSLETRFGSYQVDIDM